MAKTHRNYEGINTKYNNWNYISKFPKRLAKNWSMESKVIDELKEAGYSISNRLYTRSNTSNRNKYINSSYKELVRK